MIPADTFTRVRIWLPVVLVVCMATACRVEDTTSASPGRLVDAGASHLVIQQYGGLNDRPPLSLVKSVGLSDPVAIKAIARGLNDLPAFPGGIFCPMDDGSYFRLAFEYRDGMATAIKVNATGCQEVYVGGSTQAVAWPAGSPALLDSLRGFLEPAGP